MVGYRDKNSKNALNVIRVTLPDKIQLTYFIVDLLLLQDIGIIVSA
jgi:hypothetical protein